MRTIDNFLDGVTMYRLMLYYLTFLVVCALALAALGILPFSPLALVFSVLLLGFACRLVNTTLSKLFGAKTNFESVYITALILSLIITPARTPRDFAFLVFAASLAMASKYILVFRKKHIFNPAAFAVVLTSWTMHHSASWWVGTPLIIIPTLLGGLLVVRKLKRFSLVATFLFVSVALITLLGLIHGAEPLVTVKQLLISSPLLFFAFVMLTEPLTSPPTKILQTLYGALVGALSVYSVPEVALLAGNIFSFLVSPKGRLILRLKEKIRTAPDIWDFVFLPDRKIKFSPGQYMEWTLSHSRPDSRGTRRYFTLASSPTEGNLRIGTKFVENSSSFKKKLLSLESGDEIAAGQLSGEFTLPKSPNQKCVLIAGGIGVTPFRSMLKYLLDTKQKWPITLLYSEKTQGEFVYRDIFEQAKKELGIKVVCKVGRFDSEAIRKEVPDYKENLFYLSGPHSMVEGFRSVLKSMGVSAKFIKTDFFPGYA